MVGSASTWLAAIVAIGAAWYARGQKRAAEQPAAEAKRFADATATMATIEQERRAEEVADAQRNRVRFVLDHEGGSRYLLRNAGTDTAYGVHVDTKRRGITVGEDEDFEEFPSGDAHRSVLPGGGLNTHAGHIVVTWYCRQDRSDSAQSG